MIYLRIIVINQIIFIRHNNNASEFSDSVMATTTGKNIWYVAPAMRGSGIGNQLLSAFEKWAKSKNSHVIMIAKPFTKIKMSLQLPPSARRASSRLFFKKGKSTRRMKRRNCRHSRL
jgi:GNAT superfamily N-acetyltransferase